MNNPNNYLINGITENWQTAFSNNPPVWGFTDKEKGSWEILQSGDIIYFYASGKARGIIGKGLVLNKFHGDVPIWSEEIKTGWSKWKWRFYFNPVTLLHPNFWQAGKGPIPCSEFDLLGTSLQGKQILPLTSQQIVKIDGKTALWNSVVVGNVYLPTDNTEPEITEEKIPYEPITQHAELINIIEDMGKLQGFYPQTEFSILDENRRVDVIWRREIRGAPTYAFEVELSGGIDRSLNKLYRCYQLWSTLPRLVTYPTEREKVDKISFSLGFKDKITLIDPAEIKAIYDKKKSFKDLEKKIGLF